MPYPEQVPIAILGAGLTGLSCALELSQRVPFVLFEKTERVGGHASTEHDRGYRFDRTGHLLHLRSPTWRERVLDWLDGDCVELDRRSVVFSSGVYTRYPFQANTYGLPKEIAYECLMGFLRTLMNDESRTPENFADYCEMHFGPGFSKHFMLPYNEKLWGVPAREISATWCQRFVPLPKLEDVIQGALGLPDPKLGYNARFLYPRAGIGALAEGMARRLPSIEFGRAPTRIRAKRRELVFGTECLGYEALVSTQPLPALLAAIDELPAEVERARRKLRSTHLHYLDIALNCPRERDFHWAYVPEPKYPFYRVGCYTEFSPALAPPGTASLYVELAGREASNSEQALASVLPGLLEMGAVRSAADIAFARLRRLDYAYVIYDREYEAALGVIRPFLESLHIVSTGRYGGWNYSSMEDALRFGADAAQQALHWLS